MLGARCALHTPFSRESRNAAEESEDLDPEAGGPEQAAGVPPVTLAELEALPELVAVDNLPGAQEVHGILAHPEGTAVVVGNERRGISADVRAAAHRVVLIPMAPGPLNCLNVAAAAAVALYYLAGPGSRGRMRTRAHPARHRPDLLLASPVDHAETGSALRSAACFGWRQVLLDDRAQVWFGADRRRVAEGRAAARQARNPLRVVPAAPGHLGRLRARPASGGPSGGWPGNPAVDAGNTSGRAEPSRGGAPEGRPVTELHPYNQVVVVTPDGAGPLLHEVDLAGGPGQLVVVADPAAIGDPAAAWEPAARTVVRARLGLPTTDHYRLPASIVMAEIARQVGAPARAGHGPDRPQLGGQRRGRRGLAYENMVHLSTTGGEEVTWAELTAY